MNRKKILGLLIAVAAISIPLHAATLYVDKANTSCNNQGTGTMQVPFCSIQAGYDAAADGDELRVMPGTYTECVFLYDLDTQKGVSVRADAYVNSGNKNSTIIDGTGLNCLFPGTTNPASVVNLGGFGGKLEGFTVTGASNSGIFGVGPVVITNNVVSGNDAAGGGGGMYVYTGTCAYGTTVTDILNNVITNNATVGDGGGLLIAAGQFDVVGTTCPVGGNATVNVQGNTITGNTADGSGGGILAATFTAVGTRSAEIVITSNTISGNGASSELLFGQGGGIFGYTYGYGTESIKVMNNIIAANTTLDYGGGISMWIDPDTNDTTINHSIEVADNTLTGNEAGYGGGGIDLLVRTGDFRINQRADMYIHGNAITGNTLTADLPDQTFGGGGILAYLESQNSNSPRIGVRLEGNDISNNSAFGFGGGVSLFGKAVAVPGNPGTDAQVAAEFELRNNAITRNNASTAVQGWDGAGGGVFMLLETQGDAQTRADLPLNTIADNTIDTMNEVGGIHAESFIAPDAAQNEGETVLTLNSSIVASNDGVGFGGPSPGLPGYITPGGSDNFVVTMTYTDLHGNEAGDLDGWIPPGGTGNIFVDPLLVPLTYLVERCSPTIDAGDPAFAFVNEPAPDGGRVNMGSTGNTSSATKSIADVSGDGIVDGIDIVRLSVAFGAAFPSARYNAAVDVNGDDIVDGDDLTLMAPDFGQTCP